MIAKEFEMKGNKRSKTKGLHTHEVQGEWEEGVVGSPPYLFPMRMCLLLLKINLFLSFVSEYKIRIKCCSGAD